MICDTIGLTADSYASMYVHGGSEVEEVYGGLNYADPIFYKMQTITGTASIAFDSYPGHLTDYTILGNSYQDETPSTDNPVEVVSVGDKTENLLNQDATGWNRNNVLLINGAIMNTPYFDVSPYIEILPEKAYTLVDPNSSPNAYNAFYDSDKNFISSFAAKGQPPYTATSPSNAKYIRCSVLSIGMYPMASQKAMLIEGSTEPPAIIPYGYKIPITCGGVTTPIYIGNEPLHRIGEYADEVSFATGKIIRRVNPDTMQPYVTPVEENPPVPFPTLTTAVGSDLFTVGTTVQPSAVSITGNIKPTGYGQLLDVNDVAILDKDNEPIFIQG